MFLAALLASLASPVLIRVTILVPSPPCGEGAIDRRHAPAAKELA
jgi:hypothetical protein